jgi:outer membrane biosynthesis protein TonB
VQPPEPKKLTEVHPKEAATPQKTSTPAPKKAEPPAQVQTSIAGAGASGLGVGNGGGGGDCVGSNCGSGDGTGGDNDGYYSALVKNHIQDALGRDEKLRFAKYRMTVSFSLDASGHIVSASVASFSGDDDAREEVERVLRSISTGDSPPSSMQAKQFTVRIVERARG